MSLNKRYPSDLTDAQWALADPLLSDPKLHGNKATRDKRELVNAILYLLRTGCAWRQLPKDFPPWETVYWWFARWRDDGSLDSLHDELRIEVRRRAGRNEQPSAGCLDAQSIKGADTVPASTRGYDAGKKTGGRKRHIVVDTMGLLLVVTVTAASVQDRDGAVGTLARLFERCTTVRYIWADGGYAGKLVEAARWFCGITMEIVKKKEGQRGFEILPRRWVVERTFAWITKCRRLDHDYERLVETSEAMVKWAMVGLMTRRLAPSGRRPWATPQAA